MKQPKTENKKTKNFTEEGMIHSQMLPGSQEKLRTKKWTLHLTTCNSLVTLKTEVSGEFLVDTNWSGF